MKDVGLVEVRTSFESCEDAKRMVTKVLGEKLVACAHITEIESHYVFEGKLCGHKEWQLSMVTTGALVDRCEKFVKDNHSYKVPQIIVVPIIHVSGEYGKWVKESVG